MKIKLLILAALIALFAAFQFWFYRHVQTITRNEETLKTQSSEIETKDDVIETKIYQQKLVSKPAANDNPVLRDEWLQLLWEKGDSH